MIEYLVLGKLSCSKLHRKIVNHHRSLNMHLGEKRKKFRIGENFSKLEKAIIWNCIQIYLLSAFLEFKLKLDFCK